jgi:hypothetical protein
VSYKIGFLGMDKITIRSDRKEDYTFMYRGEEVVLKAGSILSIANGLNDVVLPTTAMKIMNNLIVVKDDVK